MDATTGDSFLKEYARLLNEEQQKKAVNANNTGIINNTGYQSLQGGVNQFGMSRPDFVSTIGADGQLDPRLQQQFGEVQNFIKDQVMSEGPTRWAQLQNQMNLNNYNTGVSSLDQNNASQLAGARSMMAMRGGLGSGARERLSGLAMKNNMFGRQGLGRDLANQNLQTSIQDQSFKNAGLANLAGAEQGIQSSNIRNLMSGISDINNYNQGLYSEDMKAYAAGKTADAQRQAASGGK